MNVGAFVTLVAAMHYSYMRESGCRSTFVPLHRLVHHGSVAEDRVLLDALDHSISMVAATVFLLMESMA